MAWPGGLPGGIIPERVAALGDFVSDFLWLDDERLIIAGKRGRLVLFRNGQWSATLLDISGRVAPAAGDRGLMGIAMDPGFFRGRPYIYVAYTVDPNRNGGMNYNMLARFTYAGDSLQDERLLMGGGCNLDGSWQYNDNCSPMPGTTHSIGSLWFPGDGSLWVSVGEGNIHDGAFWYDTYGMGWVDRALAMDPDFLGGKILRLDPDSGAGRADNPFCGGGSIWSARCKVWAVGLRNPFRCSGGPGAVYCGDVGWYTWESFKVIYRGQNMGWPCWEGNNIPPGQNPGTPICQRIYNGDNPYPGIPGSRGVVFQWNHNGASAAAIGGVQIPSYYPGVGGRWIIADYTSGQVWAVTGGGDVMTFFYGGENPAAFRVGTDGWLYYLSNAGGVVIRLRISGFTPPPNPTVPRLTTARPVPTTSKRPPDPLCEPTGAARIVVPTCTAGVGQQPIGDLTFLSREGWPRSRLRFVRNGNWGPVGLDASVGRRNNQTSGRTLNINNRWFITGWGTHALSQIDVLLNQCCYRVTGTVGVDEEVRRFYPQWGYNDTASPNAGNVSGSWTIRTVDNNRVVWNSSTIRRMNLGSNPLAFDIRNLHRFNRVSLQAAVAPGLDTRLANVWTPSHFNWAEVKAYCGPRSPYAPIVTMTQPPEGLMARPDTMVRFAATATYWDRRTAIPASMFQWDINLVHCQGFLCHQHNPFRFSGVRSGSFNASSHADTDQQYYYYSVQLTIRDRCGNTELLAERGMPVPAPPPAMCDAPSGSANENGPAFPPELILKIGRFLPPGSRTLVELLLCCRAYHALLLSHHHKYLEVAALRHERLLGEQLARMQISGALDDVEELREDNCMWQTRMYHALEIAARCPKLARLKCSAESGMDILKLQKTALDNLVSLDITIRPRHHVDGVLFLPRLKELTLRGCPSLAVGRLFAGKGCPKLESVELELDRFMETPLATDCARLPAAFVRKIKVLHWSYNGDLESFLRLPAFRPSSLLHVGYTGISGATWKRVSQLPGLAELSMAELPASFLLTALHSVGCELNIDRLFVAGTLNKPAIAIVAANLGRLGALDIRSVEELPVCDPEYEYYWMYGGDEGIPGHRDRVRAELDFFGGIRDRSA
ncbi:Sorbosone dehydrogenase-domain-containing protein [Hyaloraphidium curvatum]|nr:Sorbosone dehydrogenase-domain-containing protein [Hyaloraphidium curvatum]